jgi:hypothetical protein
MAFLSDSLDIKWQNDESGLNLVEQLYTARGSQGQAISDWLEAKVMVDPSDI